MVGREREQKRCEGENGAETSGRQRWATIQIEGRQTFGGLIGGVEGVLYSEEMVCWWYGGVVITPSENLVGCRDSCPPWVARGSCMYSVILSTQN